MEDFIKNIIIEKNYFELSSNEKRSIDQWVTNEEEFDALKSLMLATKVAESKNEKQLYSSVKLRLDERFAAKHAHKKETFWNRFLIFFFPKDKQFFNKPAFQLAMVALVVALIIPFLWRDKPAQYAMNEGRESIEIEKSKTQFRKKEKVQTQNQINQELDDEKSLEVSELDNQATPKLEQEYLDDKIEAVSSANKRNVSTDLNKLQSKTEMSSPIYEEMDEIVDVPSPSNVSVQQNVAGKSANTQSKKIVKTAETLDLLMALY